MIDGLFEVNNSDDCWHRPQNGQRVRYLGYMSVLLLNASYEPLRVISWQRAICLQLAERADVIEAVEGRALRTSCLLYTSPSPRDKRQSRMPSSA